MANEKFYWCEKLQKACFTSHECSTGTKLVGHPTQYRTSDGKDESYVIPFSLTSRMTKTGTLEWVEDPEEEKGCELYYE